METLVGVIVVLGLILAVTLGLFLCVVHPIWGMIDCAVSRELTPGAKAAWIFIMIVAWAFGSILYAFISASYLLKSVTRLTLLILATAVLLIVVLATAFPAVRARWTGSGSPRESSDHSTLSPPVSSPGAADKMPGITAESAGLEPFTALHFVGIELYRDSVSVVRFEADGRPGARVLPVVCQSSNTPTRLAVDTEEHRFYALTEHDVGTIDLDTGRFATLPIDAKLPKLSWPGGIAFDSRRRLLVVTAESAAYAYDPSTRKWSTIPEFANLRLCGLTYSPIRQNFFGLAGSPTGGSIRRLLEIAPDGSVLRSVPLSPSIPSGPFGGRGVQFLPNGHKLLVIAPAPVSEDRAPSGPAEPDCRYLVDPAKGRVLQIK